MKKSTLLHVAASLLVAFPLSAQDFLEQTRPAADFVPGQLIVKTRDGGLLPALRLAVLGFDQPAVQLSGGTLLYRLSADVLGALALADGKQRTLDLLDSLQADPGVVWAQLNYRVYPIGTALTLRDVTPNDPRYTDQWHYFNNGDGSGESPGGINLPLAWETSKGSSSVVVAVLDTGILPDHPNVLDSDNLLSGFDMVSDPLSGGDGNGRDPDPTDPGDGAGAGECGGGQPPVDLPSSWHGTHVAGTIGVGGTNNGMGVAGVNWNVGVQAVRVLGRCGGRTDDINDGIRWAAGLSVPGVPDNPTPAKVINMSLGASGVSCANSPSTQEAIDEAIAQGVTVVVSAGNDATDASNSMPASCKGVVTVAASDARGYLARYSNYGDLVDIMAPGGDIQRDDNNDGKPDGVLSMVHPSVSGGYAYYNGTSMAAPHVAGVVALWLAQDPTLTPKAIVDELKASALSRSSTQCPRKCGPGLLNAVRKQAAEAVAVAIRVRSFHVAGGAARIVARVWVNGKPQAGRTVSFTSATPDAVFFDEQTAVTDESGLAVVDLSLEHRGRARISATVDGVTAADTTRVWSTVEIALLILAAAMMVSVVAKIRSG